MSYLLAISVGPVQDFIRAGRKTRDLWYGSDLLSRVAWAAAKHLAEADAAVEVIFPHAEALTRDVAVPNKLLVLLPATLNPEQQAKSARDAAQAVLEKDWRVLNERDPADQGQRDPLRTWLLTKIDRDLVTGQLEQFLEWYAVWCPYDPTTYRDDRQLLDRLLAGRKALRDFTQPPTPRTDRLERGVRKSSLDPGRDSVIMVTNEHDATSVRSGLHLKSGEELDGISLIKRLAKLNRFVSTSRLAIEPFIQRAEGDSVDALAKLAGEIEAEAKRLDIDSPVEGFATDNNHLSRFAPFPFDSQLFWDNGERDIKALLDKKKEDEQIAAKEGAIRALGIRMQRFTDAVNTIRDTLKTGELPTYFAVLVADGDKMGKALNRMTSYGEHQRFSKRLTDFAENARGIVSSHRGALVYSGGDDVLAFLPLHTALCCADALRRAFANDVNIPGVPTVTLSVGVAIAHYSEHLDNVLTWGRAAESAAKRGGRNALAVTLHTRSGGQEAVPVIHRWSDAEAEIDHDPVANRWQRWVSWHRQDLIPDGAAFDLRDLAHRLRDLDRATLIQPSYERKPLPGFAEPRWSLLEIEVARVLNRKRAGHGTDPLSDEMIGTVLQFLHNDIAASGTLSGHVRRERDHAILRNPAFELDGLVRELVIARRLATAATVAHGKWKAEQDVCKR